MRSTVLVAVALLLPQVASAQESVIFEGLPLTKVESSFLATGAHELNGDESFQYQVRIVERNGRYYWASRGMKELIRSESGAYITYHAVDGTGYIRVGSPMLLDLRERLPEEQRRKEIGYVERLLTQFASITYYGKRK